ncbi:phospholipase C, phosphocholine-specific [Paraburkholderia jirisanensis]
MNTKAHDVNVPAKPKSLARRDFLRAAGATGVLAGASMLPSSIRRALAIPPSGQTGTIQDIKHVVILMQENRSFDHYFGTLKGVRGFGDRFPITLASGQPVWQQVSSAPTATTTVTIPPFHLDTATMNAMGVADCPHDYGSGQAAWNQGLFGHWPYWKTQYSMGYYERADIPFHFALAEAFTLCDAYHCALTGPTDPNRVVFFSGSNYNPALAAVGINPTDADAEVTNLRCSVSGTISATAAPNQYTYGGSSFAWPTLPDLLQGANVSWKIYQDPNNNWSGLLHGCLAFQSFRTSAPGSAIYNNGMTGGPDFLTSFATDVQNGTLPQVSWILPTPNVSEHPSYFPSDGANFISQVLDALTANPTVWSQTAFFITYDEEDGIFDHGLRPAVPSYDASGNVMGGSTMSLAGEYFSDPARTYLEAADTVSGTVRPWGLGGRVPMFVISPWTAGGWVNSEVFTHTSMALFLEKRFGITASSVSPWHRAVAGDLTSCFDFTSPNATNSTYAGLPSTANTAAFDAAQRALPGVSAPGAPEPLFQEAGYRPSRALPYELHTSARVSTSGSIELMFSNTGTQGTVFHVYDQNNLARIPRRYTVEAGKQLNDTAWTSDVNGNYNLWVYGPNGFVRQFSGNTGSGALVELQVCYDVANGAVYATVNNRGTADVQVSLSASAYASVFTGGPWSLSVPAGKSAEQNWPLSGTGNWYDFTLTAPNLVRRFAGRVETGAPSISDPAMASGIAN